MQLRQQQKRQQLKLQQQQQATAEKCTTAVQWTEDVLGLTAVEFGRLVSTMPGLTQRTSALDIVGQLSAALQATKGQQQMFSQRRCNKRQPSVGDPSYLTPDRCVFRVGA
jgi:hypothetical protein